MSPLLEIKIIIYKAYYLYLSIGAHLGVHFRCTFSAVIIGVQLIIGVQNNPSNGLNTSEGSISS